jgi:hypothetical protein
VVVGGGPVATLAQLQAVFAWLRERILIGTQLFVLSAEPVPVYVSIGIEVLNGADTVATVRAVQQAVAAYLWPLSPGGPEGGGWPLGRTITPDELLTQAARVPGVQAVERAALYVPSGTTWTAAASVSLRPWQVPSLQGVGVATGGGTLPSPADSDATASGPVLVPFVPKLC